MFPKGFLFLFISFSLLGSSSTRAQEYQVVMKDLNVEDGLSSRFIFNSFQDSRGYMWFDADEYGLNRYDGYHFKLFYDEEGELVRGLPLEDIDGNIWVLEGQISISDHTHLKSSPPSVIRIIDAISDKSQSLESKFGDLLPFKVSDIKQVGSQDSLIWINTMDGQFYTYDGSFHLNKKVTQHLNDDRRIFSLLNDFFIIVDDHELIIINHKGDIVDRDSFSKPFKFIKITGGVIKLLRGRYEYETFKKTIGKPLEIDNSLQAIPFFKKRKESTAKCVGLFDVNKGRFNTSLYSYCGQVLFYDDKNQLIDSTIINLQLNHIYHDRDGLIWLASGEGVKIISIQKSPFKHLLVNKVPNYSTRGITRDNNDNLYINSYAGSQILNLKTKKQSPFLYLDFLKTRNSLDFLFEKDTSMWIASDEFLVKADLNNHTSSKVYYQEDSTISNQVLTVYRDAVKHSIWAGGTHGLFLLDTVKNVLIHHKLDNVQIQPSFIQYFHENKKGLWLATTKGLYLVDIRNNTVLKHYHKKNKTLAHDYINHIHEDNSGLLWLATNGGGLIEFNPETENYKQYNQKDGFLNSVIYAVYEDSHKNLWLPTQYGLARFNKETKNIQTFLPRDGISHEEFNNHSHFKDKDGNLYFGGLNGVNVFHPDSMLSINPINKPFHVVDLKLIEKSSGEYVDYTEELNRSGQIVLNPGRNSFLIKFSLLDFISKENINYAYKLEGTDKNWQYQKENFIRLNNLPYGQHTLRIKAQGQYGMWTKNELVIPIEVEQAFYTTNWFYALCIAGLLIATFVFFRLRILSLRKRQLALEKEIADRTSTISSQNKSLSKLNETLSSLNSNKDRFFSIIGHDLRGPLIALRGLSKKVDYLIKNDRIEEVYVLGEKVDSATENVTKLLDNLLNWALVQNGTFPYQPESYDLDRIVTEVINLYQNVAEVKGINLKAQIPQGLNIFADRNSIKTIIRNLLDNALKFTDKDGTVWLSAKKINDRLSLRITDLGVGMPPDLKQNVFKLNLAQKYRKYHSKEGTGLGLVLCKDLVDMNKGTIEVESEMGVGTTFTITLPLEENL